MISRKLSGNTSVMLRKELINANRINMINNNPAVRQQFIDEYGVDSVPYMNQGSPYINLPNSVFGVGDDEMDFDDSPYNPNTSYLKGNLSDLFSKL